MSVGSSTIYLHPGFSRSILSFAVLAYFHLLAEVLGGAIALTCFWLAPHRIDYDNYSCHDNVVYKLRKIEKWIIDSYQ